MTVTYGQCREVRLRHFAAARLFVGDRGILTAARLREDIRPAGLDWITALRAPQVKALVRDGALQLSLSGQMDLAEIAHPDYRGERLVACKNPFLEAERARKRESLLQATEADLAKIAAAVQRERRPLRGKDKITLRADRVLRRRKVAKHFTIQITDDSFTYARDQTSITAEAALDGIYVLRTSLPRPERRKSLHPPDDPRERLGSRLRQRTALPHGLRLPDQAQAPRRARAVPAKRPFRRVPARPRRLRPSRPHCANPTGIQVFAILGA
jgi:hypothetical protein